MAWKAFAAREKSQFIHFSTCDYIRPISHTHFSTWCFSRSLALNILRVKERKLKYFNVVAVRIWRSSFMHSRGTIETKISDDHFELFPYSLFNSSHCSDEGLVKLSKIRTVPSSDAHRNASFARASSKSENLFSPKFFSLLCLRSTQMMWWRKFFAIFVSIESLFQFQLICCHEIKSLKCFAQHFNYKNHERNLKNFNVVISKGSHGFEWNLSSEWENGNVWVFGT